MSLGRLLATGKSLVGGQNSTSPYRLNKQMRLPKFVSPRNPFATELKAEAAPPRPVATEQNPSVPKPPAVRTAREESTKRAALAARFALAIRRSGAWLGRANPFSRFLKLAGPKKSAIPCFTESPVQSELRLDNVQVVRNDLSDADLEIVPVAPPGVKPDLATTDQCETGKSWGRLAARIFGSNHT